MSEGPVAPEKPHFAPLEGTPGHVPDITARVSASIAMIAVATLAIWLGDWPLRGLVLVAAAIMLAEWADMHKVSWAWTWVGVALLAALLLGGVEYLYPAGQADTVRLETGEEMWAVDVDSFTPFWTLAAIAAGGGLLLGLLSRSRSMGWGFVYVAVPCLSLLVLSWAMGFGLIFWLMFVTWTTDILAMFTGRTFRGPKLAPRLSPNKTWSGFLGGVIGAGVCGYLAAWLFGLEAPFTWAGAPMGAIAQLGDLYESSVKRRRGVKDSGSILPGHGGVLDRCDGLLAVAVATLGLVLAGLWNG